MSSTHSGDIIKVAVALAFSGGAMLYRSFKSFKRLRAIADTPSSKVASAPQGLVEFEGFAWPQGETVLSLDGQEAVYYTLELQREQSSGSGNSRRTEWVKVFSYEHANPFYLLDPTGIAVIEPGNCEVDITKPSTTHYSKLSREAKTKLDEFTNGTVPHFPPSESFFGKLTATKFRVVEKKIVIGSPLCAMGNFRTESFNQVTIDDSLYTFANKVIDFNSRAFRNLTNLLDTNRDGKISAEEALAGYTTAAKVSRQSPQKNSAPIEVFGILSSSENHKLFFTDKHEQQLLESLGKYQKLKVVGGAAMIAAAVCIALLRFGLLTNPIEVQREAEHQAQLKQRQAQSQLQYEVRTLHDACVNGQKNYCRQLFERKSEFGLDAQHVTYYKMRGCQLGESSLCDSVAASSTAVDSDTLPRDVSSTRGR